jgi:hypothetical protein
MKMTNDEIGYEGESTEFTYLEIFKKMMWNLSVVSPGLPRAVRGKYMN